MSSYWIQTVVTEEPSSIVFNVPLNIHLPGTSVVLAGRWYVAEKEW
jgi:hypothetical protein